jgi:MYXO-CTERM domain-containing protein
MKTLIAAGGCLLVIALLLPPAKASTITFAGTGSQDSVRYDFQVPGGDFSRWSGVAACPNPGAPCEFQWIYSAGVRPLPARFSDSVSLGDVSANLLGGLPVFSGSLTPAAAGGEFETMASVVLTGQVAGSYGTPPENSETPVALRLLLARTGPEELAGIATKDADVVVNKANDESSGRALTDSEVPEPGAMFLAAGGIGLLALLIRRRTHWA